MVRSHIWNPNATMPPTSMLKTCSTQPKSVPNPEQDAARMAALKRLRHRLVTLCSKNTSGGNSNHKMKPPTLALERWLCRSGLNRDLNANESSSDDTVLRDPVIPSDGEIDFGLVKDLSRYIGESEARQVAETMANDGKIAAEKIASMVGQEKNASQESQQNCWEETRKQLKQSTKAVKKASKSVQKSLSQESSLTESNDEQSSLESSMATLDDASKALEVCRQKIRRLNDAQHGCNIVLDTSRRPGICDVTLILADGTAKKPYLTVSLAHLTKFIHLWQFQQQVEGQETKLLVPKALSKNLIIAIQSLPDSNIFLQSLYCCLARYEAIKGAGYQCAVPPAAFDAACEELGLGATVECFASPFNCRYRNYCSAFPDVENRFGSLGSFFDDNSFFPTMGSYEANPPFVPDMMLAMNDKLERILNNVKANALSFLVVVPVWGSSGICYVERLESSPYVRAKARIAATEHSFCDGAQHKSPRAELRPSSWDTAVVLLQNNAGAERWSVQQDQLESTFCTALRRSAGTRTLGDWEKRGVNRGGKMSFDRSNGTEQNNKRARLDHLA